MELKHVTLDTDSMTYSEVNDLIQELRAVRERKGKLRSHIKSFNALMGNTRDDNASFVNRYTGEVLNPEDWELYDEQTRSCYPESEMFGVKEIN